MTYRIREVDGCDADIADTITEMHAECFGKSAPPVDPTDPTLYWWLAWQGNEPVAFAGMQVRQHEDYGYLIRSGVLREHRGNGLQVRLVRAREMKARKLGLEYIVTDTTLNTASSNSLITAKYKLYTPKNPWAFRSTLYWRKEMK